MEARNFITAREMLNDGNWILTTMDGVARYEKPPLPSWITAISASIFDLDNIIALRIPSALITIALLFFSYGFMQKITKDNQQTLIATLILSTSFMLVFAGRNNTWDIYAHTFIIGGIYFLFKALSEASNLWRNYLLAGLLIGLSFMSKGPVAHYVLLLPFLVSFGITFGFKNSLKWKPLSIMLLIIAGLSSWWAIYIYVMDAEVAQRIASKETSAWQNRNVRPFYYYWSFFTQSGLWTILAFVSLLYPYMKSRVENLKTYRFTLLWMLCSLILLSVIPEKKSRYVLPILIPLAFTCSFYVKYMFENFSNIKGWREKSPVYFNYVLIATIIIAAPVIVSIFYFEYVSAELFWFSVLSIGLIICGILMLIFLKRKNFSSIFYTSITLIVLCMLVGFPLAKTMFVNPEYKGLAQLGEYNKENDIETYTENSLAPELIWDYGTSIKRLYKHDTILQLPQEDTFTLLTLIERREELAQVLEDYHLVYIRTYDLNPTNRNTPTEKSRLKADYYLVSKK